MHSSARSTGRCAVINRDSMQTTSKMCKAEFFPDESSLPWDPLAMAAVLHPLPKHALQYRPLRERSASIRSEFSIYDPSQWNVRTSYITFCLIFIHVRDRFAITGVYMNPGN